MTSDIAAPGLLLLSHGPVTLAIGSEAEVTHWEFLGHLSAERLAVEELESGLGRLGAHRVVPEEDVASLYIDDAANTGAADDAAPQNTAVAALLLEALAVTWRARMQDISDASGALDMAAVDGLGRLDISGEPLLSELLAVRRTEGSSSEDEIDQLVALIQQLRDRIRFGAAGLLAADPAEEPVLIKKSMGQDGWAHRVHLLVAAEECLAADVLADARELSLTEDPVFEQKLTDRLALVLEHRRDDQRVVDTLDGVLRELDDRETGLAAKLRHPAASRRAGKLAELVGPFTGMRGGTGGPASLGPASLGPAPGQEARRPTGTAPADVDYEALAAIFGERFEKVLPAARERVEGWKESYPDQSPKNAENRFHRRFLDEASGRLVDEGSDKFDLLDHAAMYAMSLAVLREIPVNDTKKLNAQAKRLTTALEATGKVSTLIPEEVVADTIRNAQMFLGDALIFLVDSQQKNLAKAGVNKTVVKRVRHAIRWASTSSKISDMVVGGVQSGALRLLSEIIRRSIR